MRKKWGGKRKFVLISYLKIKDQSLQDRPLIKAWDCLRFSWTHQFWLIWTIRELKDRARQNNLFDGGTPKMGECRFLNSGLLKLLMREWFLRAARWTKAGRRPCQHSGTFRLCWFLIFSWTLCLPFSWGRRRSPYRKYQWRCRTSFQDQCAHRYQIRSFLYIILNKIRKSQT